jgi:hypothetical protein
MEILNDALLSALQHVESNSLVSLKKKEIEAFQLYILKSSTEESSYYKHCLFKKTP